VSAQDILNSLLEDKEVSAFVRYLAAYKVVEGNLGLFDKLAKARKIEEFAQAVYEALRVKERVLKELEEGVQRGDYKITIPDVTNIRDFFNVSDSVVKKILDLGNENTTLVGSVISSRALAYEGIVEVKK